MPDETDELRLRDAFRPWRNQSHLVHALSVLSGAALWIVTYATVMYLTGWDALAADASLEGITVRRKAAAPASLACGIYFGLLWTRCIGGPILNFLVYPAVITVYMPAEVFALFQPIPPDYLAYDPRPGEADLSATISGLYVGAPAAVSSFLTAILWAIFKPTEVVDERLEAHAPPGWGDDEA